MARNTGWSRPISWLGAILLVLTALGALAAPVAALDDAGAVYTLTNMPAGNSVAIFKRDGAGVLTPVGTVATGGIGTGGGLGSQRALTLSADGRWLFAVNAGSHEISAFAISQDGGLTLVDRVASGGVRPVSLTQRANRLYVLNAGTAAVAGNIAGFAVSPSGALTPLAASNRPLSALNSGAAQIAFSPSGTLLVVTERTTNRILTYTIGADGAATGPAIFAAVGTVPFGFAFARQEQIVVSEAATRAVSSYEVSSTGKVTPISGSVSTNQNAACWIAVSRDNRFGYTTNAGSASITGYRISGDGSLTRLNLNGPTATTGLQPLDMAVSHTGRYLFVLEGGAHTVSGFAIGENGGLSAINTTGALPVGAVGLAAR